jgi:hypothetical protein
MIYCIREEAVGRASEVNGLLGYMGSSRNCGPKCAAPGVNSCSIDAAVTPSRSMLSEETHSSMEVQVFDLVPTRLPPYPCLAVFSHSLSLADKGTSSLVLRGWVTCRCLVKGQHLIAAFSERDLVYFIDSCNKWRVGVPPCSLAYVHHIWRDITISMELYPSWEAASCAATQELLSILWKPKFHYRVHKSPAPIPVLSQISPIHTTPFYLSKIHLSIIPTPTFWSRKRGSVHPLPHTSSWRSA